ncbi:MAG: sugar phosphate isomerase/epimerase [Chitinophagaceae bacterium]|nr:sugar phosphate isomerase/epimerase [Chitinophagaceae bacterium]
MGAWPDIGHWARNGVQIKTALEKLKGRVFGMHLKDITAFDNLAAEDTILGKGVCGIPDVIRQMKAQKFKGVYSIEYEVNPEENMAAMKENVQYYNSCVR